MRRYVEFELEAGGTIIVEVNEGAEGALIPAGVEEIVTRASQTFEQAFAKVTSIANVVIDKLTGLSQPPKEVEVTFGLTLSAEAGVVVAAASGEANYTVTLKWS